MGAVSDAVQTILDPEHGFGRLSESWGPVPGPWPYWVSDEGRVYSEGRPTTAHDGKIVKPYTNETNTYLVVDPRADGDRLQRLVHQMVAEAFLSEDRDGRDVNHIDGDPTNNRAENLEWVEPENHITEADKPGTDEDSAFSRKEEAVF
jgi:hypothetical protein